MPLPTSRSCRPRWWPAFALAILALGRALPARADESPPRAQDLAALSLEELLNTPVDVASKTAQNLRETPGVVTVISREEILNSGARDLIDVLMLVPGFSFPATDTMGVVDLGFRGIWGHEGKELLLLDGEPMNDLLYGNNMLGNHYPVQQIQRVEIIRGAGSAIYGGFAELCVINIITQGPKDLSGAAVSVEYAQMAHALGAANLNLAYGQEDAAGVEGLNLTLKGFIGNGSIGDSTYTDLHGSSFQEGLRTSGAAPLMLNASADYRNLHLRFLYDDYTTTEQAAYGTLDPYPVKVYFRSIFADASYDFKLGNLTITPRLLYQQSFPWAVLDPLVPEYLNTTAERYTARVLATYAFDRRLTLSVGTEDYLEHAGLNSIADVQCLTGATAQCSPPPQFIGSQNLFNGSPTESTYNLAVLAELFWNPWVGDWNLGNLTVGGRAEYNSAYGSNAAPRFAYTKVLGHFHFKLLFSLAFRAPAIENIALAAPGAPLTAEHTRDGEVEVGYELQQHVFLTANVFQLHITDPIVYYTQANGSQYYANFPTTGSEGAEVDLRIKYGWGYVNASYSFYSDYSYLTALTDPSAASMNSVPLYSVPNSNLLVGFPAHKVAVSGHFNVWRNLGVNPSGVFVSQRCGNLSGDGLGNAVPGCQAPLLLLNLFVDYRDLVTPGLDVGLGVYNLSNQSYGYFQGYLSQNTPLPGPSLEVLARASYRFGL